MLPLVPRVRHVLVYNGNGQRVINPKPSWSDLRQAGIDCSPNGANGFLQIESAEFSCTDLGPNCIYLLKKLSALRTLEFDQCTLPPEAFDQIAKCATLEELRFYDCQGIENAEFAELANLRQLCILTVCKASITDAAIETLRRFTKLEQLHFNGTGMTDAGYQQISEFHSLKRLLIPNSAVKSEDVRQKLRQQIPAIDMYPEPPIQSSLVPWVPE